MLANKNYATANRHLLNRRINTLHLSFRRKPGTCEVLALSSGITGCPRIAMRDRLLKSGMTDFDYLIAGLILGIVAAALILLWSASAWAAPDHRIFAELLTKYNRNGVVDYAGFKKEETRLDAYLDELAKIKPNSLSRNDRFAFYANAYNAWTIKLILSGYPGVESIKDLGSFFKSPWKKEFVRLGGEVITLDTIEHDILRPKFKDPRVHVAVNCASKSCPSLWGEPFIGSRLDAQLNAATRAFINNPKFNRLENNTLYVSRIFKWFSEDFNDDIIGFFEQYASGELKKTLSARRSSLEVKYLDYDWSLNGN